VGQKPPRIIADHEFSNDTNDRSTLESALYRLVEQAGHQLRRRLRAACRVAVILDYSDGMRCARQVAAKPATANDLTLFELARRTLQRAWTRRIRIRHIRLICDRPTFPPAQLELFADDRKQKQRRRNLISTIDRIRNRFGNDAVQIGRTMAA
jgi:DNA polymerase-4